MPPRFAYWTILIDNAPTAFRARDAQDLLPTLAQLKRTNENVVMKWYSGGQLWASPEAAREARRRPPAIEKRGRDWRPGGQHRDPRARFDKKSAKPMRDRNRPANASGGRPEGRRPFKPGKRKPFGPKPGGDRPRSTKPWREREQRPQRPPSHSANRRWRPANHRSRNGRRDDEE